MMGFLPSVLSITHRWLKRLARGGHWLLARPLLKSSWGKAQGGATFPFSGLSEQANAANELVVCVT